MTDHYQNLGVSKTATADDIKVAYRNKAKTMHPDKGGDTAEFAEVARAYEVLKDTERRLLYDATGQDRRPPIEVEVQNILMNAFNQALLSEQDIEIVAFVRKGIETHARQIPEEIKKFKARKKKLTDKRRKITAKGNNLVHLIIDGELKNIEGQLVAMHGTSNSGG